MTESVFPDNFSVSNVRGIGAVHFDSRVRVPEPSNSEPGADTETTGMPEDRWEPHSNANEGDGWRERSAIAGDQGMLEASVDTSEMVAVPGSEGDLLRAYFRQLRRRPAWRRR